MKGEQVNTIEALKPCVRGCTRPDPDEEGARPLPLAARHGAYCDRCFYRTLTALRRSGPLVEHIVGLIAGLYSKESDGSQRTKKHPPLPMNVDAFQDANEVYSRLVYWSALWATRLNRPAPAPAARAWRIQGNAVIGLPPDVGARPAGRAVLAMARWLQDSLDDICALPQTADTDYFHDEIRDLYRLAAKWPMEDQARYAPVHCPDEDCKGRIALHPPRFAGDDERIQCEGCGRLFERDDFDRMASVFRQVRQEEAKQVVRASKVAARLAKKYGGAA